MKALLLLLFLAVNVYAQGQPPSELPRLARDLRLCLGDLGPVQFGLGPQFAQGFVPGDLNQLAFAISYYERAVLASSQPKDSLREFQRLQSAYRRAWRASPYGTPS
jgi:hypothetical protein